MAFQSGVNLPASTWEDFQRGSSLGSDLGRLVGGGLYSIGGIKRQLDEEAQKRADRQAEEARQASQFDRSLAQTDTHFQQTRADRFAEKAMEDGGQYVQNEDGTFALDPTPSYRMSSVPAVRSAGAALQKPAFTDAELNDPKVLWSGAHTGPNGERVEAPGAAPAPGAPIPEDPGSILQRMRTSMPGYSKTVAALSQPHLTGKQLTTLTAANDRVADNKRLDQAATDREATLAETKARREATARVGLAIFGHKTPDPKDIAAADPAIVDRLFNTQADNDRATKEAEAKVAANAEKSAATKRDEDAYKAITRARRENRDLTDEEATIVGGSKWGATTYNKNEEGAANRTLREKLKDEEFAAQAARRLEDTKAKLAGANTAEAKDILSNAEKDLRRIEARKRNDFPSEEDLKKDPEYIAAVKAVDAAQAAVVKYAKETASQYEARLLGAIGETPAAEAELSFASEAEAKAAFKAEVARRVADGEAPDTEALARKYRLAVKGSGK